jgi:hypothetical protein
MKDISERTALSLILGLVAITVAPGCETVVSPGNESPKTPNARLAQEMIGTWVHVGSPGHVRPVPESGGRFKTRDGGHWNLTVVEPNTGLVTENFGGTYTMAGDEYVETQRYGTEQWLQDNGKSWRFRVTVEGDTMTQYGLDNPFTEVWKRVR